MKRTNPKRQKGGDPNMNTQGDGASTKLGRQPKEDRGEIVRNNGFTENQWKWFQREAAAKGLDTMTYIRKYPAQWWIDSIEAARNGSVATQEEDQKFETFIKSHKQKKVKRSNKQ